VDWEDAVTLQGVVTSGLGRGAAFVGIGWVRDGLHRLTGFEPYPGTLNLRLIGEDVIAGWRDSRARATLVLIPPAPETCGARVVPVTLASVLDAAVVVPDVTDHADDLVEIVAAVHVRRRLGLVDGDVVAFTLRA
jgi:riboflavin kinase, archaea type